MVGKEPIFAFYDTLTDSLEITLTPIAISVQPVNSYVPFHVHNYVEIVVPLKGYCVLETRSGQVTVAENDIAIVGKETPHRVLEIDTDTIVVNIALKASAFSFNDLNFMLHSGGQSISNMLFTISNNEDQDSNQFTIFRTHQEEKIMDLLYDTIEEYYANDIQFHQIIHYNILNLFSRLIRAAYHANMEVKETRQAEMSLMTVLLYIEQHYADISLQEMADTFGFNPNYLSSYLKKQTGMTFIKLVHLQRINVAAEYLRYTSVPIEQIALKVGYENPSYFYKVFRKTLGSSPAEYRNENQ